MLDKLVDVFHSLLYFHKGSYDSGELDTTEIIANEALNSHFIIYDLRSTI